MTPISKYKNDSISKNTTYFKEPFLKPIVKKLLLLLLKAYAATHTYTFL